MSDKRSWWKNYSAFQIVSVILIAVLVIAIIVELGVIISLKQKIDDVNRKNEELEGMLPEQEVSTDWQNSYLISIENLVNQLQ